MNMIKKNSHYMIMIFNALLIIIPIIIASQWLFVTSKTSELPAFINFFGLFERTIWTPEGYVNLTDIVWTAPLKLLGFISQLIGLLPFLISLIVLKSIFKNYQQGDIFTINNAENFKKLGWLAFIDALFIKSLSSSLLILAATLTNPPGHRYLTAGFGIPNLTALFLGALLIIISWVMLEASKLQSEQKLII